MPWYNNRKPYYQLGKSLTAFFKEPVRYLKTSSSIESEFEKPYLDDSYNDLQFSWLLPAWQWNWPEFGGGRPTFKSCTQSDYEYCQVQAFITIDPTIDNVVLAGGWGNMDFGASILCGLNSTGCGLYGSGVAGNVVTQGTGGSSTPKGWVKHESRDTCTEDFDVEYGFVWSEQSLCKEGAIPRFCRGKFRVLCTPCATADPLAWVTIPETVDQNDQDVEITVSGGASNYTWTVNGDAHFDDAITVGTTSYLDVNADACGVLSIRVGNSCGDYVDFDIRVTTGLWCEDAEDKTCHGASGIGEQIGGGMQYRWIGGKWQIIETYTTGGSGGHTCGAGSPTCDAYPSVDCDQWCADGVGNCSATIGCDFCLTLSDAKMEAMIPSTFAVSCAQIEGLCCMTDGTLAPFYFCNTLCWCIGGRLTYEWKCSC